MNVVECQTDSTGSVSFHRKETAELSQHHTLDENALDVAAEQAEFTLEGGNLEESLRNDAELFRQEQVCPVRDRMGSSDHVTPSMWNNLKAGK